MANNFNFPPSNSYFRSPSYFQLHQIQVCEVNWSDIKGSNHTKQLLREMIIYPLLYSKVIPALIKGV